MMLIKGSELCVVEQKRALNMFVHRFTGDHKPQWANKEWKDGKPYPLHFKDDNDWLANTFFWITKQGRISEREKSCKSHPTWPNNPELRKD